METTIQVWHLVAIAIGSGLSGAFMTWCIMSCDKPIKRLTEKERKEAVKKVVKRYRDTKK